MNILQINKFLFPNAGAETVFFETRELLIDHGHHVVDFGMQDSRNVPDVQHRHLAPHRDYNTQTGMRQKVAAGIESIYSFPARRPLGQLLEEESIDVAHVHNAYHQLSLSILDELEKRGIPIVMTVHDWKIACPAYTLYRDGQPCRRCVGKRVPVGVIDGRCVKGSLAASTVAAAEAAVVRGRGLYDKVTRFIAPGEFAGVVLRESGVDASRIDVVPNFVPTVKDPAEIVVAKDPVVLFAGRLEDEKGVRQLLEAMRHVQGQGQLVIAGAGPLASEVSAAAARDARIRFVGRVEPHVVGELIDEARAICLFSQWEENCPMIVLEDKSRGRAAIVSNMGGLPSMVRDHESGWVVVSNDVMGLARAIDTAFKDRERIAALGRNAHTEFLSFYNRERHYAALMNTYRCAVDR